MNMYSQKFNTGLVLIVNVALVCARPGVSAQI